MLARTADWFDLDVYDNGIDSIKTYKEKIKEKNIEIENLNIHIKELNNLIDVLQNQNEFFKQELRNKEKLKELVKSSFLDGKKIKLFNNSWENSETKKQLEVLI